MKKRKPPTTEQEREERKQEFFAAFQAESDRGCVLVAVAILDELLETFLRSEMVPDQGIVKSSVQPLFSISTSGPLSSFWSKVHLLNALGFLKKETYGDLQIIREIRNHFAHHYGTADFEDPEVIALCQNLKTADSAVQVISKNEPLARELEASVSTAPRRRASDRPKKERVRFTLAVSYIAGSLEAFSKVTGEVGRTLRRTGL